MISEGGKNLVPIVLADLVFGLLLAWAAHRMGINTLQGGSVAGAIIGCLVYLSVDLMFMATMNMYANHNVVIVDVLASTVLAAGMGAAAGFVLGYGEGERLITFLSRAVKWSTPLHGLVCPVHATFPQHKDHQSCTCAILHFNMRAVALRCGTQHPFSSIVPAAAGLPEGERTRS